MKKKEIKKINNTHIVCKVNENVFNQFSGNSAIKQLTNAHNRRKSQARTEMKFNYIYLLK